MKREGISRPRLLHVATNLELGGAQSSVVEICARLAPLGYDVHLAFSSRGGRNAGADRELRSRARDAGVSLHDVPTMRRSVRPLLDAAAYAALHALMRRLRPQVAHTHMTKAGLLGRAAALSAAVPNIVHSVRGWSFYASRSPLAQRASALCERAGAWRTQAMLAVSEAALRDGVRRRIGSPSAYRVVRSGIELRRFTRSEEARGKARSLLGLPQEVKVVGGVMVLCRQKAPLDFVEVARRVCHVRRDVIFALAGYGDLADAIEQAVIDSALGARFRFLGKRLDMEQVFPAFDVLLSTSRWEGLPRVAVEAIASGVPVVATSVGGCSEVVVPGQTGLLAEPGDLDGLSEHTLNALSDPNLAQAVRAHGGRIVAPFDIDHVVAQHDALYRSLIGH